MLTAPKFTASPPLWSTTSIMQHSANSESESKNYAIIFFGKLMQKVFPLEKWIEVGRCCHLNIFSLQSERGLKWDIEGLDAQTTEEVTWSNQRGHIKQLDSKSFRSAGTSKNTFLKNRKCHQRWHIKQWDQSKRSQT